MSNHEPELEPVAGLSLSKVKLTRNTKGYNFEVTVVEGSTPEELDRIRDIAIGQARVLEAEFPENS